MSRRHAHVVVVMRHYPRYTPKELVDEYVRSLAPDEQLFAEFKAKARELKDHNQAFELVRYEERFALDAEGLAQLERLCERSKAKDVYLICQCSFEQRCHGDLLLLTARHRFGTLTSQIPFAYPIYEARLRDA